jgi:outer membrane protein TolC
VDVAPNVAGVFGGARLEILQPLYTFGKLDAAANATDAAARMSAAQRDGVLGDLGVETARAYFGVGFARELARMLEDGSQQVAKGKAALDERLKRGDPEVTVQDRLRLAALGTELTLRLSEAREKEATALEGLRALLGDRDAEVVEGAFVALSEELGDVEGYVRRSQSTSPELRAASSGVGALAERTRLEKARWWPDLGLVGAVSFARATGVDDPPSAFANDPFNNTRAEIALALRWTLEPAVQAARVERVQAEEARGSALREAASAAVQFTVRDAHRRALEAALRLRAAKEGEQSARGWVASVVQAEAVGTATAKDLADAYLAYFALHGRVLQSTYELNLAVAALERASGSAGPAHLSTPPHKQKGP